MSPIIIGAMITGSMAVIGTVAAAVITTRGPSQAPIGRRPSEAAALAVATTRAMLALALAALGGIIALASLSLVLLAAL
ncbi:hypothetical protein OG195_44410 (plasmid) [Streptomyces sp. NBC_01362]|uniref:hypothetical protein n=1 Tax=Streptomyces sp. NBC_01362 TaxID=2903839 RepID=UPI002E377F55|nr:hypothetical protein [Streptomyces sp. NBC_01362]